MGPPLLPGDAGLTKTPAGDRPRSLAGLQSISESRHDGTHFFTFPTGTTGGEKFRCTNVRRHPQAPHAAAAGSGQRAGGASPAASAPLYFSSRGVRALCISDSKLRGKGHLVNMFSSARHAVSVTAPLCNYSVKGPQITRNPGSAAGSRSNPPTRRAPGLSGGAYPCTLGHFHANPRPSTNAPCCLFSNPVILTSGVPDAAGASVWEPHVEHDCSKLPLMGLLPNPISHASPRCPALSTLPAPTLSYSSLLDSSPSLAPGLIPTTPSTPLPTAGTLLLSFVNILSSHARPLQSDPSCPSPRLTSAYNNPWS